MNPPLVVSCTVYYRNHFLVVRLPGATNWDFVSGTVAEHETVAGALARIVLEETGLHLSDRLLFVDSYYSKSALGLHFSAFAKSKRIAGKPGTNFYWLKMTKELQQLPHTKGMEFHIKQTRKLMKQKDAFLSLKEVDYTPDKYSN